MDSRHSTRVVRWDTFAVSKTGLRVIECHTKVTAQTRATYTDVPMSDDKWPPAFTLDQEKILNLLTGDRFYSNPSAALREAVLNAIDAVYRRRRTDASLTPDIAVTYDRDHLSLTVVDNGIGMNQADVSNLFAKVGASAASAEGARESVGEFGIGVVSYFMAADVFDLQTYSGATKAIGLSFSRAMLAGGEASELTATRESQGTEVTLRIRDPETFDVLLDSFKYWCRDVEGLSGRLLPEDQSLAQGGAYRSEDVVQVVHPEWVERSHLGPVADPTGWEAMTGASTVAVLYRGVFVQEFEVRGAWGIEGSIDVDPKHFKPRLNREGFVGGEFQAEVESFLWQCHPAVLESMAARLSEAIASGAVDKWTESRWASLWLSVPRKEPYEAAVSAWDRVFRAIPAFELGVGNKWEPVSLERIKTLGDELYVAPLPDEGANDVVKAALHLLRNTGKPVIRGVRKDNSWMRFAPPAYRTTADLISTVFAAEVPPLILLTAKAEEILADVEPVAHLFHGPPSVDLVRFGAESPPALRLKNRLVINTDHPSGAAIAVDALDENQGASALIAITARHAYEQLSEVAAAVRGISGETEILSPMRRRFIRSTLP